MKKLAICLLMMAFVLVLTPVAQTELLAPDVVIVDAMDPPQEIIVQSTSAHIVIETQAIGTTNSVANVNTGQDQEAYNVGNVIGNANISTPEVVSADFRAFGKPMMDADSNLATNRYALSRLLEPHREPPDFPLIV